MLGLSNEKIIDELISSLLDFLFRNYPTEHGSMSNELKNARKASEKYTCYTHYFSIIKSRINDQVFRDMLPLMDRVAIESYANFTRITRNGLAHPSDTQMERMEVLMIFISFVKYCEVQYGFKDYYDNH